MRQSSKTTRGIRPIPAAAALRQQAQPEARRSEVPEWETEHWKHEVEAEARKRLKAGIRDVGAHR